ncbi:MAG: hypothetical protein WBP93_12525 [Pyrinomonadaceae bacterium]
MLKSRLVCSFSVLLALFVSVSAQDDKPQIPKIVEAASAVEGFAPKGWRVEKKIETDLNGDGRSDAVAVISTGEQGYNEKTQTSDFVTRFLLLALRGDDGKLHRSVVSDDAVLDGDEGGVLGDPFQDVTVERGAVVIVHYGGSRDRWGYTHRYRFQSGQWMLIGLTDESGDTLSPEHFDKRDVNLSTGLVLASSRDLNEENMRLGPLRKGSYYELEVLPVGRAPVVDGEIKDGEWPAAYTIHLNDKNELLRGAASWSGPEDLSAKLGALTMGGNLYLRAEVTDEDVAQGDEVRLVTKAGRVIAPLEVKMSRREKGYSVEAKYSLKAIAKAVLKYPEEIDSFMKDDQLYPAPTGLQLEASVEVIDVDKSDAQNAHAVMSTKRAGSAYSGSIRIYPAGVLTLSPE